MENREFYKQNAAALALTLSAAAEAYAKLIIVENGLKTYYPELQCYLSPDFQTHNFYGVSETWSVAQRILEQIEKNPHFAKARIEDLLKKASRLERDGEQLLKTIDSFDKKPQDSIDACARFLKTNCDFWSTSCFLDILDPFEAKITDFIFGPKKQSISKEDLQILMTPVRSVYRTEQSDLQAIRQKSEENTNTRVIEELLEEHAKKYWWIENDYEVVKRLTAQDFNKRMKETPAYTDPLKKIEEQKPVLIKKYGLDEKQQSRLEQFLELAYLRDLRKKFNQIASYYLITFFRAVATKNHIPTVYADFLVVFDEYARFIQKDSSLLDELRLRTHEGIWILIHSSEKRGEYHIQTAGARKRFLETEKLFSGDRLVYGSTASLGKAIGPAKIVLRQGDFSKFNEGDVLITGMTRPEFVPLMKKAAAIVTDEGGITCHAAIISRELGKPCVIGTQVATKTFKDDEIVEVNANHGFIRKAGETK